MISRTLLDNFLSKLYTPEYFDDYAPNGLQIEGKDEIKKICLAVSATRESIEKAVELKACALITHHGIFFKLKTITGPFKRRIAPLITHDINLWSYHLPMDGHQTLGHAAGLAKELDLSELKPFGTYKKSILGIQGILSKPTNHHELKQHLKKILNHDIISNGPIYPLEKEIKTIGIISGGARAEWKMALDLNLDAYITGEMSEHDFHDSREAGIYMFAGGHHATEKFGLKLLEAELKIHFPDIDLIFLDSINPA